MVFLLLWIGDWIFFCFYTFTSVSGFEPTELLELFTWQYHHLNLGLMAFGFC